MGLKWGRADEGEWEEGNGIRIAVRLPTSPFRLCYRPPGRSTSRTKPAAVTRSESRMSSTPPKPGSQWLESLQPNIAFQKRFGQITHHAGNAQQQPKGSQPQLGPMASGRRDGRHQPGERRPDPRQENTRAPTAPSMVLLGLRSGRFCAVRSAARDEGPDVTRLDDDHPGGQGSSPAARATGRRNLT